MCGIYISFSLLPYRLSLKDHSLGCLLELNGSGKIKDSNYNEVWLKEGDVVKMKIDKLGEISNKIVSCK